MHPVSLPEDSAHLKLIRMAGYVFVLDCGGKLRLTELFTVSNGRVIEAVKAQKVCALLAIIELEEELKHGDNTTNAAESLRVYELVMTAAANNHNPQARTKCSVKGGATNRDPKMNK